MAGPRSLRDLVDLAMAEQHVVHMTDLARFARRDGYELTHTTISQIRAGTYKHAPSRKTLEALAHLAKVSYEVASRAAGIRAGSRRSFASQIPAEADLLNARRRKLVLSLIMEFIEVEKSSAGGAPVPPAHASDVPGALYYPDDEDPPARDSVQDS